MRVCTLSSGSNANCTYVESGDDRFLIDAGLSGKAIAEKLDSVGGCEPRELDAILVTHEHRDHIGGVGVMARRYGMPVYSNAATRRELKRFIGPRVIFKEFETGTRFRVGGTEVTPFPIPHDAAEPTAYAFRQNGRKVVVATDMGEVPTLTRGRFKDADLMVFESNHDTRMLATGPYPEYLKRRIRSTDGHLSNDQSGEHLAGVAGERLVGVLLAHLSENNNTPAKALTTVRKHLEDSGNDGMEVAAAPRYKPSRWFEVD